MSSGWGTSCICVSFKHSGHSPGTGLCVVFQGVVMQKFTAVPFSHLGPHKTATEFPQVFAEETAHRVHTTVSVSFEVTNVQEISQREGSERYQLVSCLSHTIR